jgi:squalene-hopene/tetraprenyl-beta-curcumene cyclase
MQNPVYGTACVLKALRAIPQTHEAIAHGRSFLFASQNEDGGWGGAIGAPSTIEETSLAIGALSIVPDARIERSLECLARMIESGQLSAPAPIGLYFAKLWYFERLYPLIFSTSALGAAA